MAWSLRGRTNRYDASMENRDKDMDGSMNIKVL